MGIELILIFALVAVVWSALSPDPLASALRARFTSGKRQLTESIDSALAQMDAAVVQNDKKIAQANMTLIAVKARRRGVERQVADAKSSVAGFDTAANNAASIQRADLVQEALQRKTVAETQLKQYQASLDATMKLEQEAQQNVDAFNARRTKLTDMKSSLAVRSATAQTTMDLKQMMAGLNDDGYLDHANRAEQLVRDLEDKAGATAEVADTENMDQIIERLATQAPATNVDAEVAARMAKFAKPVVDAAHPNG